jgi:transcriptional antiterminator NusG
MNNWYIIQTYSGFEQKVAETLKDIVKSKQLNEKIEEVLVPLHEVTEVKRGKRVQIKKKIFSKLCFSKNGNEHGII